VSIRKPDGILGDFMDPEELGEELEVKPRTLKAWRVKKTGPAPTIIGKRVLYRRSTVTAWLASCEEERKPQPERRTARRRA
jgi:hypothetical protein